MILRVSTYLGILVVDDYNDELITDLMADNTKGDGTKNTKVDMICDRIIIWNNPINYFYGLMDETNLKGHYIKKCNIMSVINNEKCYVNIRLIFDDGGVTGQF